MFNRSLKLFSFPKKKVIARAQESISTNDTALPGYVRLETVADDLQLSVNTLEKVAKGNNVSIVKLGDFSFIKEVELKTLAAFEFTKQQKAAMRRRERDKKYRRDVQLMVLVAKALYEIYPEQYKELILGAIAYEREVSKLNNPTQTMAQTTTPSAVFDLDVNLTDLAPGVNRSDNNKNQTIWDETLENIRNKSNGKEPESSLSPQSKDKDKVTEKEKK